MSSLIVLVLLALNKTGLNYFLVILAFAPQILATLLVSAILGSGMFHFGKIPQIISGALVGSVGFACILVMSQI